MRQLAVLSLFSVLGLVAQEENQGLFYETQETDFVIRWAFQELCDQVFDPRTTIWPTLSPTKRLDPTAVKEGDLIFVRDAATFFKTVHPKIPVAYFLLTSGDYLDSFKPEFLAYLEQPQILGWFTIHPCQQPHTKVFAIPLGIIQYNDLYDKRAEVSKKFAHYRVQKRKKLLYLNFTDWKNPERKKIRELFLHKSYCTVGDPCRFTQYTHEMAEHKFVISPPGLGPDCYRIYESLLVGTIPVIQHSYLDYLYEGLPVLFIDDWQMVTAPFLEEQYQLFIQKKYSPEKLYMNQWRTFIRETRHRLLTQYKKSTI